MVGVFLMQYVSPAFSSGSQNYSITNVYGPSANVTGWINISLAGESSDSIVLASFGSGDSNKSITLKEMLEKSPSYNYSCNPLDCEQGYSASNGETSKLFSLGDNESKIFGIRLSGNIQSINSATFNIQSNAGASCSNQLGIDLFSDGNLDLVNSQAPSSLSCSGTKNYGCFYSNVSTEEFSLNSASGMYCQKIMLSAHPGFVLGAWVKKVSGNSTIHMDLLDADNVPQGTCTLPEVTNTSGQEYSCKTSSSVLSPEEGYICIYTSGGDGQYKISGYESPNACGFNGVPPRNEVAAYRIFAEGRQFSSFGMKVVSDSLPSGEKFSDEIWNYLVQKYGTTDDKVDCSSANGCAVPIKLNSAVSQDITLNDMQIIYTTEAGQKTEAKFYDVTESPYKITSEYGRIFIESSGFSVPSIFGGYTFSLKLGGTNIVSEKIEVKNVPIIKSLRPISTASAVPTDFEIAVEIPKKVSIVSYYWDFGNGTIPDITTINKTQYTYSDIGNYEMKVTVTDTRGLSSSKTFQVSVVSPKNWINKTINELEGNVEGIQKSIQSLSLFEQSSISSVLDLDNIASNVESVKGEYSKIKDNDTEEYEKVAAKLIGISVPKRVLLTADASSYFLPENSYVDVGAVSSIAGGSYSDGDLDAYQNAVLLWQYENLNVTLKFKEFSAEYESGTEKLVKVFELSVKERTDVAHDYYLIIPKLSGLDFSRPSQEKDGFAYINLNTIQGVPKKVEFYTTENIYITDLPAFIAPPITSLSLGRPISPSDQGISKKSVLIMSLIFLILIAIIVYIFLQQWYKKKYEKHLFPNRNDLYNLVNYIDRAKDKGLNHEEIVGKLNKAKWNHEQIKYGIKKYEGRRTGMFELPLPGILKNIEKGSANERLNKKK
ncbi:MAG: PKD domain-containing protein [Nanoarchaeota archaeon]|nr:PKD domain-containing protein [Nanoarchaeota archaeon]